MENPPSGHVRGRGVCRHGDRVPVSEPRMPPNGGTPWPGSRGRIAADSPHPNPLPQSGEGKLLHTFHFHRQRKPDGLCLSDFVNPPQQSGSPRPDGGEGQGEGAIKRDSVALFVVGAGAGIRQRAEEYKAKGEYLKSHALQALAIETAEGCAEWLHRRIREDWGFPDPADMTMIERFTTKYQGRRYSFGYPACPALEDQAGIWKLLKPEEIGVQLTEGFMMEPEASVSALVFHHPDATYFSVGAQEETEATPDANAIPVL